VGNQTAKKTIPTFLAMRDASGGSQTRPLGFKKRPGTEGKKGFRHFIETFFSCQTEQKKNDQFKIGGDSGRERVKKEGLRKQEHKKATTPEIRSEACKSVNDRDQEKKRGCSGRGGEVEN